MASAPISGPVRAIDISNYTSDFDADWVRRCRDDFNVRMFIVQSLPSYAGYPASKTRQQLDIVSSVPGIYTSLYVYGVFGSSRIQDRLGVSFDYKDIIADCMLDVEDETSRPRAGFIDTWIDQIGTFFDDRLVPKFYTGRWFFDKWFPGETRWSGLGLWESWGDGLDDPNTFNPIGSTSHRWFGGWNGLDLKQYLLDTSLWGITGLDISVLSANYWNSLEGNIGKMSVTLGEGMRNKMAENDDHVLADHRFDTQYEDDGHAFTVEYARGTKGLYVSSNLIGGGNQLDHSQEQWENAGPFGG